LNISEIHFNGLNIRHILKKNLKNSYISISKDSVIELKTPNVSSFFIKDLLSKKESWIKKQLLKLELNPAIKVNIEDEALLFGEIYSIDEPELETLRNFLFRLKKTSQNNILKAYDDFYKISAKDYLSPRVEELSNIMNLSYNELKFRKMRSRWGSCSSKKIITLNTKLMKINKKLIDYIIIHELAHLIHMNHSKKFHALVHLYIPDYKSLNQELKYINLLD